MQTAEKNAKTAQGAEAKNNSSVKTQNRPSLTGKEAKDESTKNEPAKGEETGAATPAANSQSRGASRWDPLPAGSP